MSNILIWFKKNLFGCFRIEEIRDKDNKTGLKEGGVIKMSTTVLPLRDARSLRLNYLQSQPVEVQLPCFPQLLGHNPKTSEAHTSPWNPGSHVHVPFTQMPCAEHVCPTGFFKHSFTLHASPVQSF